MAPRPIFSTPRPAAASCTDWADRFSPSTPVPSSPHEIGRNTIKRILLENEREPATGRGISWETFLRALWGAIAATDFFSVEVLTRVGLIRYFVLFVIDLKRQRIEIAGISSRPDGAWMLQVARNLTDFEDGFLRDTRYLIHDREPKSERLR